jgi:putative spermidine/putrescine transport system substrate-binding protein
MGDPRRRRYRLGTGFLAAISAAALAAACTAPSNNSGGGGAPSASSDVPDKPSSPVTLNITDVAGNLQLTQPILDDFVSKHKDIISKINTTTAKAPDLPGKLDAEEKGGALSTDLVLTGTDFLGQGIAKDLLTDLSPYLSRIPGMKNYDTVPAKMQEQAQNKGVELVWYPSGPLLEFDPAKVPTPPTTAEELLAWCQKNPGKFQYAQPANSGPGRTLLMGLPYILGDSDPKNPTSGWDKTWAFLGEIGKCSAKYETGTTNTMKALANGSVWMIASTTGWDINARAIKTVPNTTKITTMKGFHWVSDAQFAVVPKGVSKDKLSAILQLIQFALTPEQQAKTFDGAYFYPGPSIKGVTIDQAPQKSQDVIKQFGRPEYDDLIKNNPVETSLPPQLQVTAFSLWNDKIGSQKK